LLAGIDSTLQGRLLTLDALTMQPRVMKLARDPQCAVCSEAS
jgi:hypothetical protein